MTNRTEPKSVVAQVVEFIENDLNVVYESRLEMLEGAHFDTHTIKKLSENGRIKLSAANKVANYFNCEPDDSLIDIEDLLEIFCFKNLHNEIDGMKISCFINERVLNDCTISDSDKLAFLVIELEPDLQIPDDYED